MAIIDVPMIVLVMVDVIVMVDVSIRGLVIETNNMLVAILHGKVLLVTKQQMDRSDAKRHLNLNVMDMDIVTLKMVLVSIISIQHLEFIEVVLKVGVVVIVVSLVWLLSNLLDVQVVHLRLVVVMENVKCRKDYVIHRGDQEKV
tara:strand:+ start:72 stop:503 length:432 start_codon:yes stop_codon:yes gene_type:complete